MEKNDVIILRIHTQVPKIRNSFYEYHTKSKTNKTIMSIIYY